MLLGGYSRVFPLHTPLFKPFLAGNVFSKMYKYILTKSINSTDKIDDLEIKLTANLDEQFEKMRLDFYSYDKIYSSCDIVDDLGIYFSLKKIHYIHIIQHEQIHRDLNFINNRYKDSYRTAIIRHGAATLDNKMKSYVLVPNYVENRFPKEENRFPKEKVDIFDVENAITTISPQRQKFLLNLFNEKKLLEMSFGRTMLILQGRGVSGIQFFQKTSFLSKRFKVPILYYYLPKYFKEPNLYYYYVIQNMLDYFCPQGVAPVIKSHPNVFISENKLQMYFNEIHAINPLFTAVLLKILPNFSVENIVVMNSTANEEIAPYVKNKIISCGSLRGTSIFFTKFYVVLALLDYLGFLYKQAGERFLPISKYEGEILYSLDINNMIEANFPHAPQHLQISFEVFNIPPRHEKMSELLQDNEVIIFTDLFEIINNNKELLKSNFLVIDINKKPLKSHENILAPLGTEYIYIFSENKAILDKIANWQMSKLNKYMGIEILAKIEQNFTLDNNCIFSNSNAGALLLENIKNSKNLIFYGAGGDVKYLIDLFYECQIKLPIAIWDVNAKSIKAIRDIPVVDPPVSDLDNIDIVIAIEDKKISETVKAELLNKYPNVRIYFSEELENAIVYNDVLSWKQM